MGKRGPATEVKSYSFCEVLDTLLKDIAEFSSFLADLVHSDVITRNQAEAIIQAITIDFEKFIESQSTDGLPNRGRPTNLLASLKLTYGQNAQRKRNLGLSDLSCHLTNIFDGKANSKAPEEMITIPKVSPTTLINWSRDVNSHAPKIAILNRLADRLFIHRGLKKYE